MAAEPPAPVQPARCTRHPSVETYLRCGRCDTPICPRCLVHTPVGARCPTCARPTRVVRPGGILAYLGGINVGLGVGMIGGAVMSFVPGFLVILPILLTGYLVGEAVSSASRRRGGTGLIVVAFACAVVGPLVGRALFIAMLVPLPDLAARVAMGAAAAAGSFGPFGLLLLVVGGVIASSRIDR